MGYINERQRQILRDIEIEKRKKMMELHHKMKEARQREIDDREYQEILRIQEMVEKLEKEGK